MNPTGRKKKLAILLEESNIIYYWIGFIMADGSIDIIKKRLRISISVTDKEHLQKFADLIKTNITTSIDNRNFSYVKSEICSISVTDYENLDLISKKFDMINNKTHNPPNIEYLNDVDRFISFFVGFVDGDGCISLQSKNSKPHFIRIHSEKSWLPVFDYFKKFFKKIGLVSSVRINKKGYADFYIGKQKQLYFIKNKAIELNLPFLERKWNKIT